MPSSRLATLLALALVVLAGCSGSGRVRYDTPQEAYERGQEQFEDEKYDRALEYFQGVFDFGRANEYADDAQLALARTYYEMGDYLLSAAEYTRFIQLFRADPRAEEAEYERAMTYYERSPSYQLDQTSTRRAIDFFQLYLNRYPQTERGDEAQERIAQLREKLARKQYYTAGLYERRELWEAAALSYETVFDEYPETQWADDALLGAIEAYIAFADASIQARQAERLQAAVEHYERLVDRYQNSPLLRDAEAQYERIERRLGNLASN